MLPLYIRGEAASKLRTFQGQHKPYSKKEDAFIQRKEITFVMTTGLEKIAIKSQSNRNLVFTEVPQKYWTNLIERFNPNHKEFYSEQDQEIKTNLQC